MLIHTVRSGETLYSIAARYGVDPTLLRLDNGIYPSTSLAVGQTLVIQKVDTFHIVQSGDTLTSIANRYGISLRSLYRNNYWLGGQPTITTGQHLVIAYNGNRLGKISTNGYAYPFISPSELSSTLPYMSNLTPFTYGLNARGGLLPLNDEMLLSEAKRLGSRALMHLSSLTEDDTFSSQRASDLLANERQQLVLIEEIVSTMERKGYRGLDVDFEFIPAERREDYIQFIQHLHNRLSLLDFPVLVALAPKTYAAQPGLLYEAHDYAGLSAAADFVLLMTYVLHPHTQVKAVPVWKAG